MSSSLPLNGLTSATLTACRLAFGRPDASISRQPGHPALGVALPVLGGEDSETLLDGCDEARWHDGCALFSSGERTAGIAIATPGTDLETVTRDLYRRMLAATAGLRLYRIWNFVPQINAVEQGLENYRRFCRGRSHAFEAQFGREFQRQLPAASAVGATAGPLAIAFLGGDAAPRHFENPHQVPAFEYPPEYGPRPPSFSRATLVTSPRRREIFVSGTAAIRGHATVAVGDLAGQLECTCANLAVIATTAGAGPDFGATDGWRRSIKVYIRHATDLQRVREPLDRVLLRPDDVATYLQADLCRADLLVEIEAILTKE